MVTPFTTDQVQALILALAAAKPGTHAPNTAADCPEARLAWFDAAQRVADLLGRQSVDRGWFVLSVERGEVLPLY